MKKNEFWSIWIIALLWGCSESEITPPNVLSPEDFKVNVITTFDMGNFANATDLVVQFIPSAQIGSIDGYQVVIVKANAQESLDAGLIDGLQPTQVIAVATTSQKKFVTFPADFLDVDGDIITNNEQYVIAITTDFDIEGEAGSITSFSSAIILRDNGPEVISIPATYATGDGFDGIALDSKGNIYISNFGVFSNGLGSGSEVYKVTPYGKVSVFASGLNVPGGILVDQEDNVFVSHGGNIDKITADGIQTRHSNHSIFGGLAMDNEGNIYSGGFNHNGIYKLDPDGALEKIAENPELLGTVGLAYHEGSHTLFAGNFNTGKIVKVSLEGTVSVIATLQNTEIGYLTEMNDFLFATAFSTRKIFRISLDGLEIEEIAGTGAASQSDGPLNQASFNQPNGIAGDAENNTLYVSDWGTPRISKIILE